MSMKTLHHELGAVLLSECHRPRDGMPEVVEPAVGDAHGVTEENGAAVCDLHTSSFCTSIKVEVKSAAQQGIWAVAREAEVPNTWRVAAFSAVPPSPQ
ncbi:hypothetical protein ACFYQ5_16030 [Streptomyces sp. NPDC005794]|uniref:hypothetical protein n=1 Tax=Streptomyces sp. NPDC005794 TaxID=3364733 RepID=UPI0036B1ABF5